ncbi:MAG: hypothetical protein EXS67_04565 [Candidatus Margulisbacteria bacterium]|nr:hypothetical protein [Candidatus Margulisiibacteriota bacterium]
MKKQMGLLLAGVMMVALPSVVKAADVDALVSFSGQGNPTGRFYFPVVQDMRLVTGVSVMNPSAQSGKAMGYSVLGGLELTLPWVGRSEITTTISKTTTDGSDTIIGPLKLTKNAVYNITKDVKIGLSVDLLTIGVDSKDSAGKHVNVLTTIYPVVGATINF